jgi:SAM-dependent methyltransferase
MDCATLPRLNWGCGPDWADLDVRWIHSDCVDWGQHECCDVVDGLSFGDGSLGAVVANHSLQCLTYEVVDGVLDEFARVLAPGGYLRILVPDVLAACQAFLDGDETWPGFAAISEHWSIDRKFSHYLTWGGSNRSCFTRGALEERIRVAGFDLSSAVPHWVSELDSRLDESVIVTGRKR